MILMTVGLKLKINIQMYLKDLDFKITFNSKKEFGIIKIF